VREGRLVEKAAELPEVLPREDRALRLELLEQRADVGGRAGGGSSPVPESAIRSR